MYGREPVGTRAIAVIHAIEATTAVPVTTAARARPRRGPPVASTVPTTSAGSTNQADIIFAWKPTPMKTAHSTNGHPREVSTARCHHTTETASAMVSSPSSMGCANIDTKIGVDAAAPAATRPTPRPPWRSPSTAHATTVTTPSTTCGSAIAEIDMPNRRMLSAWGTAKPLSLSSVTVAAGSNAPNSIACHDDAIDRADAS